MNLPALPTDNLYKFLAIFGLVMGLAGFYFPEIKKYEIQEEVYQFDSDKEKIFIEQQKFEAERTKTKAAIEDFYKMANIKDTLVLNDSVTTWTKIVGGPNDLIQASKNIEKILEDLKNKRLELQSKQSEIEAKTKIIDLKREQVNRLDEIAYNVLPISVIIMAIGFMLWYFKSQRLQDLILKEQYVSNVVKPNRCQSCGMSLSNDDLYESLDDDSKKKTKYCSTCFADGSFTEPELTKEQMKAKIRQRLMSMGYKKWQAFLWHQVASDNHLEELERWRKPFKWK